MTIHPAKVKFDLPNSKISKHEDSSISQEELDLISMFVSKLIHSKPLEDTEASFLKDIENHFCQLNHRHGISFIKLFRNTPHHPLSELSLSEFCQIRRGYKRMRVSGNPVGAQIIKSLYFSSNTGRRLHHRLSEVEE